MTSKSRKLCAQCGESVAETLIFSKDACGDGGDCDVYGDDGNVAFVLSAAMLATIRANDTDESRGAYAVEDFCSTRCLFVASHVEQEKTP